MAEIEKVKLPNDDTIYDIKDAKAIRGLASGTTSGHVLQFGADGYTVSDSGKSMSDKQDTIDSSHKLSADLIDDTNATNKFATAAQLDQIETNKNNISFLTANGGGKNKYSVDSTVTGSYQVDATKTSTGYQLSANGAWAHLDQEITLPSAGRYVVSMTISNYNSNISTYAPSIIICPTSSISAPYLGSIIVEGNGEIVLTVETTNPVLYIAFYVNRSSASSPSSSFEASNVMVCSESEWAASHQYQPYAMSNAELTEKVKQNQNDILSEQAKTTGMSAGGANYITVGDIRLYVSSTAPTGARTGDLWIGG